MITIGLTGGIGVGKTYIAQKFIAMGIPVFNADDEAKKAYEDPKVISALIEKFGSEIMINDKINLKKLSELLFNCKNHKKWINNLIHPIVIENFTKWRENQQTSSVMMESAIIFEAKLDHFFDKIIVIDAPKELRIERIKNRNPNLSEEEILQRIDNQISQEEKCIKADWVIKNI